MSRSNASSPAFPFRALILIAWLPLVSGCSLPRFAATGKKTATSAVPAFSVVEVESKNGSISVVCQPGLSEALVEATFVCRADTQNAADERLLQAQLIVENEGGKLRVFPRFPEPDTNGDSASITLLVPGVESANLITSNGAIDVDGTLVPINGLVVARTSNAKVQISMAQSVDVDSSNGDVVLEKIAGDAIAKTSNASVSVKEVGGKAELKTSNGKIDLTLSGGQQGPVQAVTSNSSIRLKVAPDFAGRIEMDTSNARIAVNDPANRISESDLKKSSGTISIGNAQGPSSQLKTSNGSIDVSLE